MCVKHKNIFDINFKRLVLDDLFYLDRGTKAHFEVKKDNNFMQHSGVITKACDSGFLVQHTTNDACK